MQLTKDKRPSVIAGLVAALSLGMAVAAMPAPAMAAEQAAPQAEAVELAVSDDLEDVSTGAPAFGPGQEVPAQAAAVPATGDPEPAGGDQGSAEGEGGQGAADDAEGDSGQTTAEDAGRGADAEDDEAPADGDAVPGAGAEAEQGGAVAGAEAGQPADGSGVTEQGSSDPVGQVEAEGSAEVGLEAAHRSEWVSDGNGSYLWYDENGVPRESGWLVTDVAQDNTKGSLQRYWLGGEGGSALTGLFEAALDGITSWFFGTADGYVARGAYTDAATGYVYLADNDGRLADAGWVVSDDYGHGLQRYWVDEEAHAAIPGFSEDGWAHYTTEKGYVLRQTAKASDGTMRCADNDGRLRESGWLVTDDLGHGLQRYWLEDFKVVTSRLIDAADAGWDAYATSQGYVVRGGVTDADGTMLYADNDGRLMRSGWLVTNAFGQGLQRYWLEDFQVVRNRIVSAAEAGWAAYATDKGFVLRGATTYGDGVLLADNDGRLETREGWVVSSAFGSGLQRYFLRDSGEGYSYAVTDFFQASLGSYHDVWFYGDPLRGYVLRGKTNTPQGLLLSNNEGVLAESLYQLGEGFVTTSLFEGKDQLYYFANVDGHLFAKTGVFQVGDKKYFGRPDAGYVVRGKTRYGQGMIIAAADGALFFQDVDGFVVTDAVDGHAERYYVVVLADGVRGARLGSFSVGSDNYYGREDQGYVVRGKYVTPSGRVIYGDNDGKITYDFLTRAGWAAWEKVKGFPGGLYSYTQYLLIVDTTNNRTVVFQGTYIPELTWYGNWTPLYDWACSTGAKYYHDGDGTPHGTYRIGGNADYNWDESGNYTPGGYRTTYWAKNDVKYFTGFVLNLGFHSTIGYEGGYSDSRQLGKSISHGCIRLTEANARWIFYNALPGTKVYVY